MHTVDVTEVIDRGPASVDPFAQRLDHALAQARILSRREPPRRTQRMYAGAEERLVGVDIADAGDAALVEQKGLHRGGTPARERPQMLDREALIQRLQPQPRGKEVLHRLLPQQQLAGAEAAGIDDHQAPTPWAARPGGRGLRRGSRMRGSARCAWLCCSARRAQLEAHAHMRRLRRGLAQNRTGHAQMLGEEDLIGEAPQEVLAASLETFDAPPDERVGQFGGRERARPARVKNLDPQQAPTLDQGRKLATDGLDLGELGQGSSLWRQTARCGRAGVAQR